MDRGIDALVNDSLVGISEFRNVPEEVLCDDEFLQL